MDGTVFDRWPTQVPMTSDIPVEKHHHLGKILEMDGHEKSPKKPLVSWGTSPEKPSR